VTIQTNRTLGGLGACFTLVGAVSNILSIFSYSNPTSPNLAILGVSSIFSVFAFVGFILFLIAMYGFSRDYIEHKIFNLIIYGIIITIVAAVIALAVWFVYFFVNLVSIIPNINSNPSSPEIQSIIMPYLAPITAIFGSVGLINIVFTVRALNLLSNKSVVPMFRNGAKFLLAGGLVTLVLGIVYIAFAASALTTYGTLTIIAIPGSIVQEVGWALLAIAFFRIKVPSTQTVLPSTATVFLQMKYCSNCGVQNPTDAAFCIRCGKALAQNV